MLWLRFYIVMYMISNISEKIYSRDMENAETRALYNALMLLKIFFKIIRAYNGPRLIARVTLLIYNISYRENVKRWTNIWWWRRCYSSKLSVHPPVLRIQSSSICLRVSPWTLPYYPYYPSSTVESLYRARIKLIVTKATIFFMMYICESASKLSFEISIFQWL